MGKPLENKYLIQNLCKFVVNIHILFKFFRDKSKKTMGSPHSNLVIEGVTKIVDNMFADVISILKNRNNNLYIF